MQTCIHARKACTFCRYNASRTYTHTCTRALQTTIDHRYAHRWMRPRKLHIHMHTHLHAPETVKQTERQKYEQTPKHALTHATHINTTHTHTHIGPRAAGRWAWRAKCLFCFDRIAFRRFSFYGVPLAAAACCDCGCCSLMKKSLPQGSPKPMDTPAHPGRS